METLASRRAKPLAALLAAIVVTPVAAQTSSVTSPRVDIIGTDKSEIERIPGSAYVVDKETLESSRVFTTNEALRKVPGINVRDEEGLGLRPNIGIRGLNPTRSTKVTLLEDGVPLAYAPYGDNASYYHPPIDRYERIEVLKGAGQVMYGPQTIGGVINYITPTPPEEFRGMIGLAGGNRDYGNARVQLGGAGFLLDYSYKQADGARDNIHSQLNDLNLKKVFSISERQGLTLRANYYSEESQVTYSGLTTAEFNRFGSRYNPFKNDSFDTRRFGLSATHEFAFSDDAKLTTNVYASWFSRDWWRQSSTTTDTQCGNAFRDARLAGDAVNVDACNSIQGRLRDYFTYGIEPRMHVNWAGFGTTSELDFGVKLHFEEQKRKQINAANPFARTGALGEDNVRNTSAYSAFVMNKFILGRFSLSPGLRYEYIDSERTNYPNTGNTNYSSGKSSLDAWIPSLGGTFQAHETTTVFAGIHRGFAPPRTEDIINTGQGPVPTFVDVGAEKSWNSEIGLRSTPVTGMNVQATWFRNDFERLIAVGSIAGGSTSISQGKALFEGLELSGRVGSQTGLYGTLAWTWLPTAEQESAFRRADTNALIQQSAAGKRMPYAPKHTTTAGIGYMHPSGLDMNVEAVYVSDQFSDFTNTENPSADGQFGRIPSFTVYNAAVNYRLTQYKLTLYVAVKNLADKVYIVDRTRGILPGMPRLVQVGLRYDF